MTNVDKSEAELPVGGVAQTVQGADDLEDAAKAIFDVLCPGVPYTAEDAFWYRKAARAALAVSSTDRTAPPSVALEAGREESPPLSRRDQGSLGASI